jgi:hypothetical protein
MEVVLTYMQRVTNADSKKKGKKLGEAFRRAPLGVSASAS